MSKQVSQDIAQEATDNEYSNALQHDKAEQEDFWQSKKIKNSFHDNPHYVSWGITAFLVIAASIAFCFLIFNIKTISGIFGEMLHILRPIIYGLILAYLMNPLVNWLELSCLNPLWKKLNKDPKKAKGLLRGLAIGITIIVMVYMIYLFFSNIIPQLVQSIQTIAVQFPTYTANFEDYINKMLTRNPELRNTVNSLLNTYNTELEDILTTKIMPSINKAIASFSSSLLSSVVGVLTTTWNLIIGLIISIYLLASKEHFAGQSKKTIYAICGKKLGNRCIRDIRFMNHTFGDYIRGKLIDSLIIGLLCFIGMTCMNLPYTLLISVIVGVTNIIPFFGPYLGAIPSAMLILMVNPKQALIFIIFVLILQQFDGNFLGPKILGESTGLSSFWILFSITLMGGYFGVPGMAIGVPVFAILYALIRSIIRKSLRKKGLSTQTKDYMNLYMIKGDEYIQLPKKTETVRTLGTRKKTEPGKETAKETAKESAKNTEKQSWEKETDAKEEQTGEQSAESSNEKKNQKQNQKRNKK